MASSKQVIEASYKKLEVLEIQVANSSEKNRNFFTATLVVFIYLSIVVVQTSDLDLLIGRGVHLPLIDVTMPIFAFYLIAPLMVLALHFNLLQNIENHHAKLIAWRDAHSNQTLPRESIYPFIFDFATLDKTGVLFKFIQPINQILIYWSGPITTLLILWRFTDYQSGLTTAFHFALLSLNLWLVMLTRKKIDGYTTTQSATNHTTTKWGKLLRYIQFIKKIIFLTLSWCVQGVSKNKISNTLGIVIWSCGLLQVSLLVYVTSGSANFVSVENCVQKIENIIFQNTDETKKLHQDKQDKLEERKYLDTESMYLHQRGIVELFFPRIVIDRRDNLLAIDKDKLQLQFELSPRPIILDTDIAEAKKNNTLPAKAHRASSLYDWFTWYGVGIDLRGRSMRFAELPLADLRHAWLENTKFQGANLTSTNLTAANLKDSQLQQANLSSANLLGANFTNANLHNAKFDWASLEATVMTNANLIDALMINSKLYGTTLTNADLTKANLRGAKLFNITINENTQFKDCIIINTEVGIWIDSTNQLVTRREIEKELAALYFARTKKQKDLTSLDPARTINQKRFPTLELTKTNNLLEQMQKQGWPKSVP